MTRSNLQPGPATDHYHDTLGVNPSTPSGGSLSVDNGVDPPAEVATLVAPGATLGDGTATLPLSLRWIGPFRVNFDDALVDTGRFVLTPVESGTLILDVFAYTNDFDGSASAIELDVVVGAATSPRAGVASFDCLDQYNSPTDDLWVVGVPASPPTANIRPRGTLVRDTGMSLYAGFNVTGGTMIAGYADVYAIITNPGS